MADCEVEDWLSAAITVVAHYPAETLHHAAAIAKRTVDHPSKIVPALVAAANSLRPPSLPDDGWDGYELRPATPALPPPAMTPESIASLPPPLVEIGLRKGWLARDAEGVLHEV